ncbi:CsbD family protein [Mycobacterium celatum]|uniref:CsbD family protein n=1 Tax=Mycobacterium celatum TaxID=28045 RepID=A0A1X1RKW1_MYCCE|nr:CsbD family protein [Mycobacterium celatum]ORV08458.1 general stress protein CsbD [Mycobacterium celatum]PIB78523.1 CsbD family protein [Mycobacterium celatum]
MGAEDKARNKLQELTGRAKETIGRVTGNRRLENRGIGDRAKSELKGAGEKVEDVFRGRRGRRHS